MMVRAWGRRMPLRVLELVWGIGGRGSGELWWEVEI